MEISKHSDYDNINKASNGLSNLGNTCFFNSILQLLYQCTVLNKLILSNNFTGTLISYYSNFLNSYLNSRSYISPSDIVIHVSQILGRKGSQQEDADQYLNYIIDSLINELKDFTKQKNLGQTLISNKNLSLDELINNLFTIKIKKTLQCPNCLNCSESDDDINKFYLSIDQQVEQSVSEQNLKNLIDKYLFEILDPENKWKCDNCSNKVQATISRKIIKLPKYLIITLKRYDKFNNKINTPTDMASNININNKSYYLRGIVFHYGTTSGGHYVYYGNKGENINKDDWFLYDDSSVSKISNNTISDIKKHGYIYLYISK